jgi:glyoxylase-like metal-dependent hydrolase (beta-lactamase superfamily II)
MIDGITIRGIFCTHAHFDHIIHGQSIREKAACEVFAYEAECPSLLHPTLFGMAKLFPSHTILPPVHALKDGDILTPHDLSMTTDEDFVIKIIHTPGHSIGSMCIFMEENTDNGRKSILFSGDTVFAGTVGRTDFGGSMIDMMSSVRKISMLPDDTIIFPGHGKATTLLEEKRSNPYFTVTNDNGII